MSLYKEYVQEIFGQNVIEDEVGFITYKLYPEKHSIQIIQMYTVPEKRNIKHCFAFHNKIVAIGKKNNCKYMTANIEIASKDSDKRLKLYLWFGFIPWQADRNIIFLMKEI